MKNKEQFTYGGVNIPIPEKPQTATPSDKMMVEWEGGFFYTKDVREFIRKLKDEINSLQAHLNNCHKIKSDKERMWVWENIQAYKNKIDKLAGDKLVENK